MPLYAAVDGSRWFDVPDAHEVPGGSFEVRTMVGLVRSLDEAALAPFEIDQAAARDRARQELAGLVGRLEGGVEGFAGWLRERGRPVELLAPLKRLLAGVDEALRREGDPEPPPPPTPEELRGRLEAWIRGVADDPGRVEEIRRVARTLRDAAEQLRAAGDPDRSSSDPGEGPHEELP